MNENDAKRPVLERQPFHAAELGGVVREEPETASVSGNEEIVGAVSAGNASFLRRQIRALTY
jgi:hypothetical protein